MVFNLVDFRNLSAYDWAVSLFLKPLTFNWYHLPLLAWNGVIFTGIPWEINFAVLFLASVSFLKVSILTDHGFKILSFLEKFLPNVIKFSSSAQIIVADNNSTDDSVEFLKIHFPQVKTIINNANEGFAKGYNTALRQVDAHYYVLLNSDVEVSDNWLEPIVSLMDSNKQIAACQPKILDYYHKNKFEYAGASGGFIDMWKH